MWRAQVQSTSQITGYASLIGSYCPTSPWSLLCLNNVRRPGRWYQRSGRLTQSSLHLFFYVFIFSLFLLNTSKHCCRLFQTSNQCWGADVNSLYMLVLTDCNETTSCVAHWPIDAQVVLFFLQISNQRKRLKSSRHRTTDLVLKYSIWELSLGLQFMFWYYRMLMRPWYFERQRCRTLESSSLEEQEKLYDCSSVFPCSPLCLRRNEHDGYRALSHTTQMFVVSGLWLGRLSLIFKLCWWSLSGENCSTYYGLWILF